MWRVLKREGEVEVGDVGIRTGDEESEELEGAVPAEVIGGRAVRVGA